MNSMKIDNKYIIATVGIIIGIVLGELLSKHTIKHEPVSVAQPVAESTSPAAQNIEPTIPKSLPIGTAPFGNDLTFGPSYLTVQNFNNEEDSIVKAMMLVDGKPMMARNFYVPAGKEYRSEKFPSGRFILRFMLGKDWNEQNKSFNKVNSILESVPFDITDRIGMTITLHKVVNGNMHVSNIDQARFSQ